jgi:hypothetical protein
VSHPGAALPRGPFENLPLTPEQASIDVSIQYWMAEQLPLVLDGKRLRVRLAGQK